MSQSYGFTLFFVSMRDLLQKKTKTESNTNIADPKLLNTSVLSKLLACFSSLKSPFVHMK